MAAYRRVYDSRHLHADSHEPGSAPEPYARMRYLYTVGLCTSDRSRCDLYASHVAWSLCMSVCMLRRSRCRLWRQTRVQVYVRETVCQTAVHIGANWRIRPNDLCVAAMRSPDRCFYCCKYSKAVFENTYFLFFFSDFKKHDFLRFFEMIYQKVVKSHQQKFSPQ